jgi:hypothetical protein
VIVIVVRPFLMQPALMQPTLMQTDGSSRQSWIAPCGWPEEAQESLVAIASGAFQLASSASVDITDHEVPTSRVGC